MERNTFVYLDPKGDPSIFAQCASCKMFIASRGVCSLHGMSVKIKPTMSCNMYSYGKADESELDHVSAAFTPAQSGLEDREVRCENCEYFDDDENECKLFKMLNLPDKVNPHGCCNANIAEEKEEEDKEEEKPKTIKRRKLNLPE